MPTAAKPKNIVQKLAEVMGALDKPLAKSEFNKQQKYAFVSESAISAAVRPLLAERSIWIWSSEVERETFPLYETSSGLQMWLTRVTMQYRFMDGETGEVSETQTYSGQGADIGDKGLPKAQSMALKYFLLKTFMLSTGKDDAEADENVDKQAAAAGAKKGAKVSGKASTTAQKGGKTGQISDAQKKAITDLARQKQFNKVTFSIALTEALDIKIEEDADLNAIVAGLSSDDAGKVIQFLGSMPEPKSDEGGEEGGQDGDEEAMSIV